MTTPKRPEVKVALITGGMYEKLYTAIPEFEEAHGVSVSVSFRGTHPELNAHLGSFEVPPYDLVSTHTKYAPSQKYFLAALDDFPTEDFFPAALNLATIDDRLYAVPRNIDLRLLHYRTDLLDEAPSSWEALIGTSERISRPPGLHGFVFPGKESGLFGTFFELAEGAGARIFPPTLKPELNNEGGRWALNALRKLYHSGAVPKEITGWHYDEVHTYFRNGGAAMVADWPGFYGSYRAKDSPIRDRFRVARMPAGSEGRVCCYAGCHTFALTKRGSQKPEAHALLRFLIAPEQQNLEAQQGSVPVRRSVMEAQHAAAQGQDEERLQLLRYSIDNDLMVPPKLASYPEVENLIWRAVRDAITGEVEVNTALEAIESRIWDRVRNAVA